MRLPRFTVQSLRGQVALPDSAMPFTHLQFRRYAGCPICNFHLHSFVRRASDVRSAGIREVIFFHSSIDELRKYQSDMPFDMVADPDKLFYQRFGIETSPTAALNFKAIGAAFGGMALGKAGSKIEGGRDGLPGDFLIDSSGNLLAAKYGASASDHWEVDDLLKLAGSGSVRLASI